MHRDARFARLRTYCRHSLSTNQRSAQLSVFSGTFAVIQRTVLPVNFDRS